MLKAHAYEKTAQGLVAATPTPKPTNLATDTTESINTKDALRLRKCPVFIGNYRTPVVAGRGAGQVQVIQTSSKSDMAVKQKQCGGQVSKLLPQKILVRV